MSTAAKPPPTPKLKPSQQELEAKLKALQEQLDTPAVSPRRERFRDVYDWSTEHAAIAFDVLSLVPVTAPFAPLVKVVLGFAVLSADGRKATDACSELMKRLLEIHDSSLPLRSKSPDPQAARKPIDDAMEGIMVELSDYVTSSLKKTLWNSIKGFKKGIVLEKVAGWTTRVNDLQFDYIVPSLRTLENLAIAAAAASARIEAQGRQTHDAVLQLSTAQPQTLSKLKDLPPDLKLIGRERDVERALDLLTTPNDQNLTEHVVLVGLGGIGKTSLATKVAYDARAKALGRPVFIRCERLDTLEAFQTELLRLRAPAALQPGEILEQAVLDALDQEPIFLILDNLLDSSDDTAHATYLEFIDTITSISSLTLLITSRNHIFIGRAIHRTIHDLRLDTLASDAAEQLFRNEYARLRNVRTLEPNEPDMAELIDLLDGIPLAIVLVAAHARRVRSLADVILRWKGGRAWDNGTRGRTTSLDFSLLLSFQDPSISNTDTLTLLRLIAELPSPILRRRERASETISRALDAIVDRSIGQIGQTDATCGPTEEFVRILQPVREYILRHHSPLDINTEVVRDLTLNYFADVTDSWDYIADRHNTLVLIKLTDGIAGRDFKSAQLRTLLSDPQDFGSESVTEWVELLKRNVATSVHVQDYESLIRYPLENSGCSTHEEELKVIEKLTKALQQAKAHKLHRIQAELLEHFSDCHQFASPPSVPKTVEILKETGYFYLQHKKDHHAADYLDRAYKWLSFDEAKVAERKLLAAQAAQAYEEVIHEHEAKKFKSPWNWDYILKRAAMLHDHPRRRELLLQSAEMALLRMKDSTRHCDLFQEFQDVTQAFREAARSGPFDEAGKQAARDILCRLDELLDQAAIEFTRLIADGLYVESFRLEKLAFEYPREKEVRRAMLVQAGSQYLKSASDQQDPCRSRGAELLAATAFRAAALSGPQDDVDGRQEAQRLHVQAAELFESNGYVWINGQWVEAPAAGAATNEDA